jgi:uncharacterized RDD family membrane protein YckC
MTDVTDSNRFAPPKADLTEPGNLENGIVLAGRGQRLVAAILDTLLLMVLIYGAFFVFGGVSLFARLNANTPPDPFALMGSMFRSMAPGYVILLVIQGWAMHTFGGTVGKRLMGLRIVRTDGTRPGFARVFFARGAVAMVPNFIPFLNLFWWLLDQLLIFRDSRQCLHDQMVDTIVVSAASSMGASLEASRSR